MASPISYLALARLVRAGTLFSPGADVIAGLCLAGQPWTLDGLRAVVASILLYAAGMVFNDHADRELDARRRPERPIPRGDVTAGFALKSGLVLMAVALITSPVPWHHGAMAMLVLLYNYSVKRQPVPGAAVMGFLRGLNLATGFVVAGVPSWPDMAIACGAYSLYIVAVTLLGIMEDEPRVRPRVIQSLQALPPLVSFLALLSLGDGFFPAAACSVPLVVAFAARNRAVTTWDRAAIRGSMTWLLLGTMVYTSLLCLAAGRVIESLGIVGAILAARRISRHIALT